MKNKIIKYTYRNIYCDTTGNSPINQYGTEYPAYFSDNSTSNIGFDSPIITLKTLSDKCMQNFIQEKGTYI